MEGRLYNEKLLLLMTMNAGRIQQQLTRRQSKAVVITEIKLKQNKRKTMFCFSETVLFQCRFSVFTCETKR